MKVVENGIVIDESALAHLSSPKQGSTRHCSPDEVDSPNKDKDKAVFDQSMLGFNKSAIK